MIKILQEKRRNRAGLWPLVLGLEGWMPNWRKEYSTLYSGSIQDPERRNRAEAGWPHEFAQARPAGMSLRFVVEETRFLEKRKRSDSASRTAPLSLSPSKAGGKGDKTMGKNLASGLENQNPLPVQEFCEPGFYLPKRLPLFGEADPDFVPTVFPPVVEARPRYKSQPCFFHQGHGQGLIIRVA